MSINYIKPEPFDKMTDCSSIQGSTTSSSSDVPTFATTSSWCSISNSSRIRVIRLIRPNPRFGVLVTPNNTPSFGFAIRGGKEYGTGFFVSSVERYGEANQKGLKIGDQLIRVNGYRVDDAVHKELVQYISGQDRLTLKVRGIGMLPQKDKENDSLIWRTVRPLESLSSSTSLSCTEDPFKAIINKRNNNHNKDKRIILNVAPRSRLGLGICKGPAWKPGIFIQFTKSKSVAREAGLRPGDQILCVNSIDFSDVLFSEAVAVMKSSTKLDMVVRTGAGCDLFPGESSGYNSSASSVTGDQSPCWADISAKRLTVVREEPSSSVTCNNESIYADVKKLISRSNEFDKCSSSSSDTGTLKELNKTIIKLCENGTSINNTFIEDSKISEITENSRKPLTKLTVRKELDILEKSFTTPIPPPPPPSISSITNSNLNSTDDAATFSKVNEICFVPRECETKTVAVEVHRNSANSKRAQQHQPAAVRAATANAFGNDNKLRKASDNSNNNTLKADFKTAACEGGRGGGGGGGDGGSSAGGGSGGSSLCSAIAEELKRRKEKQRETEIYQNNSKYQNISPAFSNNNNKKSDQVEHFESPLTKLKPIKKYSDNIASILDHNDGDQHSALMNEFKRAHQRMFKNGFQENDHKERQDILRNTVIMDNTDEANPFSRSRMNIDKLYQNIDENTIQKNKANKVATPSSNEIAEKSSAPFHTKYDVKENLQKGRKFSQFNEKTESENPPTSPTPDYEPIQVRSVQMEPIYSSNSISKDTTNKHKAPSGAVTIGEYSQKGRKEPAKFDFLTQKNSKEDRNISNSEEINLRAELEDTLSRSNLRKASSSTPSSSSPSSSSSSSSALPTPSLSASTTATTVNAVAIPNGMNQSFEHQSHCHLHKTVNFYNGNQHNVKEGTNIEKLTRLLQGKQEKDISNINESTQSSTLRNQAENVRFENVGNGILKNGNNRRNNRISFGKNSEKSISFGN